MKVIGYVLLLCYLSVTPCSLRAQTTSAPSPAIGTQVTPAQTYGKLLAGLQKEFVELAEAMPEDKYNFAPAQGEFQGVRTFGEQVKHIAEANYEFFGKFANADPSAAKAIEKLNNKAEILKALNDSFLVAHKAIDSMTAQNAFEMTAQGTRAGMAALGLAHIMDHYGQLVVYVRMNGIVPPASRKSS
jgi:uncharacterized damage-inducible protein DinB